MRLSARVNNVAEFGICPAAVDENANGINQGKMSSKGIQPFQYNVCLFLIECGAQVQVLLNYVKRRNHEGQ